MGDRDEWPMAAYAPADAILVGTWRLASGNSITVRGRQRSSGAVDVWRRWARPPSAQDRWDHFHELFDPIQVQIRAAFELVAGLITSKEEDGPALQRADRPDPDTQTNAARQTPWEAVRRAAWSALERPA